MEQCKEVRERHMPELHYNGATAVIKTDNVDEATIAQVTELIQQPFAQDSKIVIMPDCHAGAGCVIGTTMTIKDKVCPNLVGVDIGCGMYVVELGKGDLAQYIRTHLAEFDKIVQDKVPSGFSVHKEQNVLYIFLLAQLRCYDHLRNVDRHMCSIGTLGGGNHFIELDTDDDDNLYLVIHSGSRNLGVEVATYYQKLAIEKCHSKMNDYEKVSKDMISLMKKLHREKHISEKLAELRMKFLTVENVPNQLCYVTDEDYVNYMIDMNICQKFASMNRVTIADEILTALGSDVTKFHTWHTVHNYIDIENNVLRKGAVSARKGERLIIPMNMRDGSLICVGKGNPDWNYSAPHGAGRIMSRTEAKANLDVEVFKQQMNGVFSTTVGTSTIDESPMAYKPMDEIIKNIEPTVEILKVIKPIYNFKAGD
jgi:RNA-splicing ligase RtcB